MPFVSTFFFNTVRAYFYSSRTLYIVHLKMSKKRVLMFYEAVAMQYVCKTLDYIAQEQFCSNIINVFKISLCMLLITRHLLIEMLKLSNVKEKGGIK